MVNKIEDSRESPTVAYVYSEGGNAIVVSYTDSTAEAAKRLIADGRVGGQDLSAEEQGKLASMVQNLSHLPDYRHLQIRMPDPRLCKNRPFMHRGH